MPRVRFGFMGPKIKTHYSNQTSSDLVGLVRVGPDLWKKLKNSDWFGLDRFGFAGYSNP